jgi:hypothetical protein
VDAQKLTEWLGAYKRAWVTQDADLFLTVFTPDCEYWDRPYVEPVPGKEFDAFWRALAERQRDNHTDFEILALAPKNRAIVNWQAVSIRVPTDERREGNGIFLLTLAADGRCSDLREWQHWRLLGAPLEKREFSWKAL